MEVKGVDRYHRRIYVDISSKAAHDDSGALEFIVSTQKDVTDLKAVRDSRLVEASFRDLLDSTPDAIVIVNVTGRIILANSQAEKVFGYATGELVGQPVEILLPHRYRAGHVMQRTTFFDQPRNAAIVSSAIDLGRNLKLNVIAEGVEDAQTLDVLRELGCDAAQGCYFSRPAPVDEITAWLRESPRRFQPD